MFAIPTFGNNNAAALVAANGNAQRRNFEPTSHLLILDKSSAGGEFRVIWDATKARLEPSNTWFVKIDALWST